ncbi:HNH endonuclease [Gordonia phage Gibbles]|nr:HNH endonuclease [Gordonia phage Gibbles]
MYDEWPRDLSKKEFYTFCKEQNLPCWICNEPIDYKSKHRPVSSKQFKDVWTWSLDHYIPKSLGWDLQDHSVNWRPAHARCNWRRGNRIPERTIWVGPKEIGRWYDESEQQWIIRMNREYKKRVPEKPFVEPYKDIKAEPVTVKPSVLKGPGIKPWRSSGQVTKLYPNSFPDYP